MTGLPAAVLRGAYAVLRAAAPVVRWGRTVAVTRHDDVRQVLEDDVTFAATYSERLDVVLGTNSGFLLGLQDGQPYRDQLAGLRTAVHRDDIESRLPRTAEGAMERLIAAVPDGEIDAVAALRRATSRSLAPWLGVCSADASDEELAMLERLAERLFRYQFVDASPEPRKTETLLDAADLRALVQARIASAQSAAQRPDHVIGRLLPHVGGGALSLGQSAGLPQTLIGPAVAGLAVGGLPQPPIVAAQALDQLLRRPTVLAEAKRAAWSDDRDRLGTCVIEALRFDPLAPFLRRVVVVERAVIAPGSRRETRLRRGDRVLVVFASAMLDPRRVDKPREFRRERDKSAWMPFGHGLHSCFADEINQRLLPALIAPLLRRHRLARAGRWRGRLRKSGVFADRLLLRI